MTRTLLLSAVSLAVLGLSAPAFADHHGDKKDMHKKMEHHMSKKDTDGDGKISKAEADAYHAKKFEKMDLDGDGYITKEEKKEAYKKMKEKRGEYKEKMKEKRDAASEE
tara:strand:+ start:242 stop:568 length:327 start_codon:yes stop_codon:yes gene_type:complete